MEISKSVFSSIFIFSLLLHLSFAIKVTHDGRALIIDGQHRVLVSGSIHYPRSTPEMWPDLIKKSKEGGLDAIETYVFWNIHEPQRRQYDFTGRYDLIRFLKAIQAEGLYAILRIGPYACAEWTYGGLPMWLHNMPGLTMFRTNNDVFMEEMKVFTTLIVDMVKKEKLFASQGGHIILSQIENEYGNVMSYYGDAEKTYINWCAQMADAQNIGIPWVMCQQGDAPQPMINTCNGWYCDWFTPNNPNSPKIWTENWTGWFTAWGGKQPLRTAEDLAFAVARFYQRKGTLQNYYMYHGGTNFGRTAGGPYMTTSYDYDAPLDEYGNLKQPKWGHLKELHAVLHKMEKTLTQGNISETDMGNNVYATVYALPELSSCFLSNTDEKADATIQFRGNTYTIPAWSISILPDCKTEEYNTAKINTQTSIMVKKLQDDKSTSLKWSWRPEYIDDTVHKAQGQTSAFSLLDQKSVANDTSDYLWYMTRFKTKGRDAGLAGNVTFHVTGTGHVIHAYVNGELIGIQWGKDKPVFEKNITLRSGKNIFSLLSATVGFQNYGQFYDLGPAGLIGPVVVSSSNEDTKIGKDLSKHKWSYKVGLHGFEEKFYNGDPSQASKWNSNDVPINSTMTWYKTTFKAPPGNDPVVLDMLGLGKGEAWVNGNSIGRYWPSAVASSDGCSTDPCNYRGAYSDKKCVWNCGKPTQRWYHVPRSFLNQADNTLILFEEFGGDPTHVNVQTVVIGTACGNAYETKTLELSCNGRLISAIKFASYGAPQGSCESFKAGSCTSSKDVVSIVNQACVGKASCSLDVSDTTFGATNCGNNVAKRLAVEATCGTDAICLA